MAKSFRHMRHQPTCEKAAPLFSGGACFYGSGRFLHFYNNDGWQKKKPLSQKQHVPLDPPPPQFVPLPHFTPTRMPDWDSASNSNNHLSLVQILEDETLKLDFNLPVWLIFCTCGLNTDNLLTESSRCLSHRRRLFQKMSACANILLNILALLFISLQISTKQLEPEIAMATDCTIVTYNKGLWGYWQRMICAGFGCVSRERLTYASRDSVCTCRWRQRGRCCFPSIPRCRGPGVS